MSVDRTTITGVAVGGATMASGLVVRRLAGNAAYERQVVGGIAHANHLRHGAFDATRNLEHAMREVERTAPGLADGLPAMIDLHGHLVGPDRIAQGEGLLAAARGAHATHLAQLAQRAAAGPQALPIGALERNAPALAIGAAVVGAAIVGGTVLGAIAG